MRIDIIFKKNLWIIAIVEFEKHVAGTGIFEIIICKFSHWQEAYQVILFAVHEGSKVCLCCTILPFCLVIDLRIKSRKESSLDF